MLIRYVALPTDEVRALQAGAPDAYGMTPERRKCPAAAHISRSNVR